MSGCIELAEAIPKGRAGQSGQSRECVSICACAWKRAEPFRARYHEHEMIANSNTPIIIWARLKVCKQHPLMFSCIMSSKSGDQMRSGALTSRGVNSLDYDFIGELAVSSHQRRHLFRLPIFAVLRD